jgi:hypothetical protein
MFGSKTPEERYHDVVTASENRHRGMQEAAERDHATAVAKADAARALAVSAADDKLRNTTASLSAGLRQRVDEALHDFDRATRAALHVHADAWLRQNRPGRVELRFGTTTASLAVATDEGGGRWMLTTETETMFLGSAELARAALWRIAAAVPTPAAPVA